MFGLVCYLLLVENKGQLHNEAPVIRVSFCTTATLDQEPRIPSTLLHRTENENALRQFGLQQAYFRLLPICLVKS
jgi:hypothetical protein